MKNSFSVIIRYFLSGSLFIVPVLATGYFIFLAIAWLDGLLPLPYPGLGLLIILSVITGLGYFTSNYLFKSAEGWFDQAVNRIPLVKLIYSSIKDLMSAFVGEKKKFRKPVVVLIDESNNLYQMGFVTQEDLSELGLNDMVSVYLPHSYNFSGDHFMISKDRVRPLNISGAVAMKYVVSGGVSGFKEE